MAKVYAQQNPIQVLSWSKNCFAPKNGLSKLDPHGLSWSVLTRPTLTWLTLTLTIQHDLYFPDLTCPWKPCHDWTCLNLTRPDLTCLDLIRLDLTCPDKNCPDLTCSKRDLSWHLDCQHTITTSHAPLRQPPDTLQTPSRHLPDTHKTVTKVQTCRVSPSARS